MILGLAVLLCLCCSPTWADDGLHHSVWFAPQQPQHDLSRADLVQILTNPQRYDRHQRPQLGDGPVNITASSYIYMVQSSEGRVHLQLKLTMKLYLAFWDHRLQFADLSPDTREVYGEGNLLRKLWTPHLFLSNERQSLLMSSGLDQDILVRIRNDGLVSVVTRFTVSVVCHMKIGRFPFDQQECPMFLESWLDDAEELVLRWGGAESVTGAVDGGDQLSLNSFSLQGWHTEEDIRTRINNSRDDAVDRFGGSYSSLTLTFWLAREYGFFIMDYYMPSILLVFISWVSFWLEPDMIPARVLLGSSTMLTFITLAVQTDRSLPVSYVKASEIWFVGCTTFILGSLFEFAFVNSIWRHGQSVELKKVTTKHILRSTLGTPKPPRRRLLPQERYARRRTSSLPDLFKPQQANAQQGEQAHQDSHPMHYNTIHNCMRLSPLAVVSESAETLAMEDDQEDTVSEGGRPSRQGVSFDRTAALHHDHDSRMPPQVAGTRRQSLSASLASSLAARLSACNCKGYGRRIAVTLTPGFTRMSAQEVSDWIDRRSRIFFPLAFFVFNCVYWTSVIWF